MRDHLCATAHALAILVVLAAATLALLVNVHKIDVALAGVGQ